jgi:hypothetical protein
VSRLTLSQLYWGVWIFVLFLVPEILAATGAIPMYTLSTTSWMDQQTYPVLRTILFGFLVGLAVHIRFTTSLGKAELGGIGVALILHALWGLV